MKNALVIQLARFGDLIQTKRLLLSIAQDGQTHVHLAVDASLAPLAKRIYPFAHIHALPAHKSTAPEAVFQMAKNCFAELCAIDFSDVYNINFSPLSFACASLFAPETLRGYSRVKGQEIKGRRVRLNFNLLHDRRFSPLNLVDAWALLHPAPIAPATVNPIPKAAGTNRIGIVLAGRESRRSLPPAELAACIEAIFEARKGPELVCIGSKAESSLVRRLMRELSTPAAARIVDLSGKTALTDLPEIMQGLDMVLTPDTGAMHLAAHLGVPVQAFFLSSAWCYETGPYGFGHKVWQAITPCAPCLESAPCDKKDKNGKDIACLSAFSHPGFLAHLRGRFDATWPEHLLGCVSMLDGLGVTYRTVDGANPYEDARSELRSGLAEYAGLGEDTRHLPAMRPELAEFLFTEREWMLP